MLSRVSRISYTQSLYYKASIKQFTPKSNKFCNFFNIYESPTRTTTEQFLKDHDYHVARGQRERKSLINFSYKYTVCGSKTRKINKGSS